LLENIVRQFLIAMLMSVPMLVSAQEGKSSAVTEMEKLAQTSIQEALKVVQESGGFYPFGLLMDGEQKVRLVGYRGDAKKRPPAEEFAVGLFLQLREAVASDSSYQAAVVVKPLVVESQEGVAVPGVWVAVDHRNHIPWVLFQPLIALEPGKYTLGEIIYQPSEEAIFPVLKSAKP
jgi:hypothetical protein